MSTLPTSFTEVVSLGRPKGPTQSFSRPCKILMILLLISELQWEFIKPISPSIIMAWISITNWMSSLNSDFIIHCDFISLYTQLSRPSYKKTAQLLLNSANVCNGVLGPLQIDIPQMLSSSIWSKNLPIQRWKHDHSSQELAITKLYKIT